MRWHVDSHAKTTCLVEMGSFFAKPATTTPGSTPTPTVVTTPKPSLPLVRTNKFTTNASGAPMPYIRIPKGGSRRKGRKAAKSLKRKSRKQRTA